MKRQWISAAAVIAVLGLMLLVASAQEEQGQKKKTKKKKAQAPQQQQLSEQEMMQRWMQYMTPGEEHERLAEREGTWNFVLKMRMAPGAPEEQITGQSVFRMIMGGRYLEDHTTSTFDDMPFEGRGLTGYDNMRKKYVAIWYDNMGTGFMVSEGDYDEQDKVYTYTGKANDPMRGQVKEVRTVERRVDDDTMVIEMYETGPGGEEFKSMEINYERVKQ